MCLGVGPSLGGGGEAWEDEALSPRSITLPSSATVNSWTQGVINDKNKWRM